MKIAKSKINVVRVTTGVFRLMLLEFLRQGTVIYAINIDMLTNFVITR